MINVVKTVLLLLVFLLPQTAFSEADAKKFALGMGTYILNISSDKSHVGEDNFSGLGLSASYSFSDQFLIRGQYYYLEHDDYSGVNSTGMDATVYFGMGLLKQGVRAYIGSGLYAEAWKIDGYEREFSDLQLSGGFGYSWNKASLDYVLTIRGTDDYEELANNVGSTLVAVSYTLILSAKF